MWHYQVIKYKDGYGISEKSTLHDVEVIEKGKLVLKKGKHDLYTDNLLTDKYESVEDLVHNLKLMLKDAKKYRPVSEKKAFKKLK